MIKKDNYSSDNSGQTHYFLRPGYIFVPDHSVVISTVTGSGVSVCIYDKKQQKGGMNHFQLPYMAAKGKTTALYGNVAVITLIRMMQKQGYKKKHLEAQIFGGACRPDKPDMDTGRDNIDIARKILIKEKISIISEDTGGKKGRKIVFDTGTSEVAVLKVDNLRDDDWYPYI